MEWKSYQGYYHLSYNHITLRNKAKFIPQINMLITRKAWNQGIIKIQQILSALNISREGQWNKHYKPRENCIFANVCSQKVPSKNMATYKAY